MVEKKINLTIWVTPEEKRLILEAVETLDLPVRPAAWMARIVVREAEKILAKKRPKS